MDRSDALQAAGNIEWNDRATAGEVLATFDDTEAGAALDALLADPDLAVVKRTVAALLAMPSADSLRRFTSAYVNADDQVGDAMNDELRAAVVMNPRLRLGLTALAEEDDLGAQMALEWLG